MSYPEGPSLAERSGYHQLGSGPDRPRVRNPRANEELRACAIVKADNTISITIPHVQLPQHLR